MENNNIKKETIDTIFEEGTEFYITIDNPNILHKLHLLPKKRKFVIYPMKLGSLLKISKELIDINAEELENIKEDDTTDLFDIGLKNIIENKNKMVKIVSYGIINKNREPPKRLLKFLDNNLSAKELLRIIILIVQKMDVSDFLACIVSMKRISLLGAEKEKKKIQN